MDSTAPQARPWFKSELLRDFIAGVLVEAEAGRMANQLCTLRDRRENFPNYSCGMWEEGGRRKGGDDIASS